MPVCWNVSDHILCRCFMACDGSSSCSVCRAACVPVCSLICMFACAGWPDAPCAGWRTLLFGPMLILFQSATRPTTAYSFQSSPGIRRTHSQDSGLTAFQFNANTDNQIPPTTNAPTQTLVPHTPHEIPHNLSHVAVPMTTPTMRSPDGNHAKHSV